MNKVRHMIYTKENGDVSHRDVVVVSQPRKNYLVYDLSKLSENDLSLFVKTFEEIEEYRNNCIADFELLTGIKQASLWRSFKPEGIEWITEDDNV